MSSSKGQEQELRKGNTEFLTRPVQVSVTLNKVWEAPAEWNKQYKGSRIITKTPHTLVQQSNRTCNQLLGTRKIIVCGLLDPCYM